MIREAKLPEKLSWLTFTKEYQTISHFYEGKVAKRSKVPYMNHIIEGCIILDYLRLKDEGMKAFCLHPLCQDDKDLLTFLPESERYSSIAVGLAIEFGNVANGYLSKNDLWRERINLSPVPTVNDMLIADKVQNFKDFLLYHKGTHPRSEHLEQYFINWLTKLDVQNNLIEMLDLIGYRDAQHL